MTQRDTDSNLLFGVLALQLDLVDQRQFVEACNVWAGQKDVPLAEVMCGRGWITPADRADVERLMGRKLDRHQGDPSLSLASLTNGQVAHTLAAVADFEVRSVLSRLRGEAGSITVTPTEELVPDPRTDYPLVRLHAQGGLGRVWVARDPNIGRQVALKEIRPEWADDPLHRARFLAEARITGQLEHPGIVPVYQLTQRPGDQRPFYTMRFIRGRTLSAAVRDYHARRHCSLGHLELTTLLNAFTAACNAVAYAHARRVVHRDLKGPNIILGDYGEVIVVDWGLAKLVGDPEAEPITVPIELEPSGEHLETTPGQRMGTLGYMSPEQAEGRNEAIGPASDIYSLGAVLYEILVGQRPFRGSSATEALRQAREEDPPWPHQVCPAVPRPLDAICRRAMAKRPEDRYPTATELARDVQRWLADEPVSAYPEPLTERLGRWARWHRSYVAGATALLFTAVLALGVSTVLIGREQARTRAAFDREAVQRRQAEAHFSLARSVVDRLYYQILDSRLLDEPGMDPLRAQLIGTTLEAYRDLAGAQGGDPSIRNHLAYTLLRSATAAREQGAVSQAIQQAQQARDLFEGLVREHPENAEYPTNLVNALFELGYTHQETHQWDRALAAFHAAVEVARGAAVRQETAGAHRLLAVAHDELGSCLQGAGQLDRAAEEHSRALALWDELARTEHQPDTALEFLKYQAVCRGRLGNIAWKRKQLDRAEDCFRYEREAWERIVRQQPSPNHLKKLAEVWMALGKVYAEAGQIGPAESALIRAREVSDKIAADHPHLIEYACNQAVARHNLSELYNPYLHPPGRPDLARSNYREALAVWKRLVREHPDRPGLRNQWAHDLFGMGTLELATHQPEAARASFQEARELWEALPGDVRRDYDQRLRDQLRSLLRQLGP